ncbi:MAG: ribonuclease Y [Lachnospira sp.]|uniref:Ribonuclease Y n=1 Tax=Lachnospira pectinoschiza TaxID=28052 RepID=A0A1G9VPX6_9FIRM|nr:ribonuclease Y [Lachnospira pectinoschiza]MCR5515334.1 ribonuclease Y [Lachnospira sp.]SDM74157.1 ribonucrease Y [Lachnospira pectinoschiza]
MDPILIVVFAVLVVIVAIVAYILGNRSKISNANKKAREIVDEAIKERQAAKTAKDAAIADREAAIREKEAAKKEALLEIKEESIKARNELEKETRERRNELSKYERRVTSKEESLDKKIEAVEKRDSSITKREEELSKARIKVEELEKQRQQELERISGLTSEQAKEFLLKTVEDEVKHDTAVMIKTLESRAKEEADKKAREYVVNAIQRCAADHVAETTISVVQLPNDEMKGRIIGREGRNIRTLETMTGVELIIDDTPEAVVLSGFDPVRREVARIALEKLILDGRIHPARIEEMVEKAQKEVEALIKEEGEAATLEVGVHGIHPELVRLLGKLRYRTSYGQNVLRHSIEVAQLAGLLAAEMGLDVKTAKRAGLLHDIGKAVDHEMEGSHVQLGVDLCRRYKESPIIINAVEAHHGDVEPESLIACLVQAADTISAARPGARRETLETYTNRLKQLEDITNSFKGVEKSFAIQAGREVRVMVVPEVVSDTDMVLMARDISKQIEDQMEYPGQIKVSIIRESRAVDYAK